MTDAWHKIKILALNWRWCQGFKGKWKVSQWLEELECFMVTCVVCLGCFIMSCNSKNRKIYVFLSCLHGTCLAWSQWPYDEWWWMFFHTSAHLCNSCVLSVMTTVYFFFFLLHWAGNKDSRRKVEVQTSPECEWSVSHTRAVFVVLLPQSCLEVVCLCVCVCVHFMYLLVDRYTHCNKALGACLGQWNQVHLFWLQVSTLLIHHATFSSYSLSAARSALLSVFPLWMICVHL